MGQRIKAVVPVKNLVDAKQRLSAILSSEQRRGLFRAMLEDVLRMLCTVDELDGVCLVTRDPEAKRFAAHLGAEVIEEPANRGHTAAVTFGAQALTATGVEGLLTMPGDVPLATADEVRQVLNAHHGSPAVTIVPSDDEFGSNAVACSPPGVLAFQFGDDSFRPHLAQARALGIEPTVVRASGIGLDVDTPEDLRRFSSRPSDTRAYAFLQKSGILDKLRQ